MKAARPAQAAYRIVRPRGRPPKSTKPGGPADATLTRDALLDRALELTRYEPLSQLSVVRLAKAFGVTPAAVHYHLDTRDALTAGVIDRFYRMRLAVMPRFGGRWQANLAHYATGYFDLLVAYPGVAAYFNAHNKFRVFQLTESAEQSHGVLCLERLFELFTAPGFTPAQAALDAHLLVQFVLSSAHAEVNRQLPAHHREFLHRGLSALDAARFSSIHRVLEPFVELDTRRVFQSGLVLLIAEFGRQLRNSHRGRRRKCATGTAT